MTSEPVRDPQGDHLLTPQNCALIFIDYQPTQIRSVKSMDQDLLVDRGSRGPLRQTAYIPWRRPRLRYAHPT